MKLFMLLFFYTIPLIAKAKPLVPISNKYATELPACHLDKQGKPLNLKTSLSNEAQVAFRARHGYDREEMAENYVNSNCSPNSLGSLKNQFEKTEVVYTALLLSEAKNILINKAEAQLNHIQFLKNCYAGQTDAKDQELCKKYLDVLTPLIKKNVTKMRTSLAMGTGRPCTGRGPTSKDYNSYTKYCSYNLKPKRFWLDNFMADIDPPPLSPLSPNEVNLLDTKTAELRRTAHFTVAKNFGILLNRPNIGPTSQRALLKNKIYSIASSENIGKIEKQDKIAREFVGRNSSVIQNEFNNLKQNYRQQYKDLMATNPYLNFISSADPSDKELSDAFAELDKIATKQLKNVKAARLIHIAEFPDAIDAAIRQMDDSIKGDICQMAHYALERKGKLETGKMFLLGGMALLTLPLGATVAAGVGAAEMLATGTGQLANVRAEYQRCLANVNDPSAALESQCRPEKLAESESSLALTALLSPLAVVGLGSAARATSKSLNAAEQLALEAEERAIQAAKISEAGGELTKAKNLLQADKTRYVSEMKSRLRTQLDDIVPITEQNAPAIKARELIEKAISEADEPKEIASLFHQMKIIDTRRSQVTRALGGDEDGSLLLAIVISDLGKLKSNSKILLGQGEKAFVKQFFGCAQLNKSNCDPKVYEALEEYLKRSGRIDGRTGQVQTLLNRNMSPEEIQKIFATGGNGGFQRGFKHELPGIAEAFQLYKDGVLTKNQFMKVLHFNIGHNGPGNMALDAANAVDEIESATPFWGLGTRVIGPNMATKADEVAGQNGVQLNAAKLDDGTIFSRWIPASNGEKAKYIADYPDPKAFLIEDTNGVMRYHYDSYDHLFKDRIEGTYSGAGKFVMEGKDSPMAITGAFDSMVTANPIMTASQVRYARRGLEAEYKRVEAILQQPKAKRLGDDQYYTADDLRKMKYLIEKGKTLETRLTEMRKFLQENVETVKGEMKNGKFVRSATGEDSIRVAKYMDDQGRDVTVRIHESAIEINRGGKISTHTTGEGDRANVIEQVLSTVADELYTFERASSESGNILKYLVSNP